MTDNRTGLPEKYILKNNDIEYQISEEVGRGANCIVYNSSYLDTAGLKHLARVKELFPTYLLIERCNNYGLSCDESHRDKFEKAKKRFEVAYEGNVRFRNTYGVMNSTVNASDMFFANGTIYVVMNLDEGTDYRSYTDKSLPETMTHVRALATVINNYHTEGYLHLDIKPENVFIIPETAEHVYLFDFDSVCKINDLKDKKIIDLSYSEGFSAPEQVQGNISKIGPQTDIYSIGAVLFYKLFNRRPTFEEGRYSAIFNYEDMIFYDKRLSPAFFKCLDEFLHKTLATSTSLRWDSLEKVIDSLDELMKLSDTESAYMIDTFTYNSANFVGRTEEIEEIHEEIQNNNVLFLSGIGGIGKTELAKKFISEYRDEFDTVAFVYFQETIEHTVCQEILINNMFMDEDEKEAEYFERVIDVLRKSTTERDLILLDNFDVERDDRLEDLLKCSCKFLITTRNRNIRDWNYNEVKVDRMNDEENLLSLFAAYNDEVYEGMEYEAVRELIDFVHGHTMTVELISKYLRDSGQRPSMLHYRFMETSGVTNTDNGLIVNQRKDHKMNAKSINQHLSILFDVFNFDNSSKEIISSLSLFAGIRIRRELFVRLCSMSEVDKYIDSLISKGWVENDEETDKILLHQVIQDLIYTKLNPTTENCSNITSGMYQYIKEDTDNYSERRTKRKVFEIFADRISGKDISYSKICLEYGKDKKIEEAILICQKIGNEEAYSILTELYMENIRMLCQCDDMFECEDSLNEYGQRQITLIDEQFRLAIEACENAYSDDSQKQVVKLIRLAKRMDDQMSYLMINGCFDDVEEVDLVYQRIIGIFEQVNETILEYFIPYNEKEKLLETARDFYSDGDFCAMYRWEHYSNFEKVEYYQELLDELRESEKNKNDESGTYIIIHPGECSYCDIADGYMEDGNYEAAIKMFKKAYDADDEPLDWILPRLSKAYLKMGNVDSAVDCLVEVLDYDKCCIKDEEAIGHYSGYVCLNLIKILIDVGRKNEAKAYAQELKTYLEPEILNKADNLHYISDVLVANWYLYNFADNQTDKKLYWNDCMKLFNQMGNAELYEEHIGFIRDYLKQDDVNFNEIVDIINRFNPGYEKEEQRIQLIEEIIDEQRDNKEFGLYHIQLLIKCAEITSDYSYKGTNQPLVYCRKAEELLTQIEDERKYYSNKIIKVKAEAMSNDNVYDFDEVNAVRKQCNYYLVAKHESQNMDNEKKIDIWKESADKYGYVDDYQNQIRCLEQAYTIMLPILNQYDYSRFDYHLWYIMNEQVIAWLNISSREKAIDIIREMYIRTLDYYKNKEEEKHEYLNKIKEIADLYERAGDIRMAFRGFLMWIYIILSVKCDDRILVDYFGDTHDIETIIGEISVTISSTPIKEIDSLIEFKESIERLDLDDQELQLVQPLLNIIIGDYQNKDVEFK